MTAGGRWAFTEPPPGGPTGMGRMTWVPDEQMAAEVCVAHGGHCYVSTGETLMSNPPQHPEKCRHCPATRVGVAHAEPMVYTYPEGQP